MTPVRVVMVVRLFHPWVGGMERQALTLARALRRSGHDVRVLTGRWFPRTPRRETVDGVPVLRHAAMLDGFGIRGLRRLGAIVYMISLAMHLLRLRASYDLIHVHGLSYHAYVAARIGRLVGVPVVVKLANSGLASDIAKMRAGQHLWFTARLLPGALQADRFVALSESIASELEAEGVPPSRITQVPNGVEMVSRERVSGKRGVTTILYLGRLHEQKAVDVLLRAAAVFSPAEGLRLVVAGDGPERRALETLAGNLQLEGVVRFLGEVTDIDEPFREADLLVLPSRAEGLSNTLLEAMVRRVPVIASDITANRALIEHGETGWLFPVDDPDALAATMGKALADQDLLVEVAEQAHRSVSRHYAIDAIARRYASLYEELLEST